MLRKFFVVIGLLGALGTAGIAGGSAWISEMESQVDDVKVEFYADDSEGFTKEQKDWMWSEAMKVVEEDLSDLDFGGSSYDK